MSTRIRSYKDYFLEAREKYKGNKPDVNFFYKKGVMEIDPSTFSHKYMDDINTLSEIVNSYFDKRNPTDNPKLIKYENFSKIRKYVKSISEIIVPYFEQNLYGCHLYVDKVYTWRNVHHEVKEDSWLWHFDNNPNEIHKIIIYLNDVDKSNAPFQYLMNQDGFGKVIRGTRQGMDEWKKTPSRISDQEINNLKSNGYQKNSMIGKKGLLTIFNNNLIHRATIPEVNKYRDVVVIRVKPTINKIEYIDEKYTTSWETSGVVNQNPNIIGD
tara:strand:+ start:4520 stop:5326 length:807 start_codon:yes stop_codon:yes gene_type:complete